MSSANPFTAYAKTHFTSSGASGLYDRARPRYPPAALSQITSYLPSSGGKVVELGAGTGIFSRMLLSAAGSQLSSLVCVEPAEGMRQGFAKKLEEEVVVEDRRKVKIVDGAFDKIPVEDGSADLIVAAQAFHWIGHDGASAIDEFARVLKPGGKVALIWNLEDRSTAWVGELRDAYEVYEAGTPQQVSPNLLRYRHGYWKSVFTLAQYPKLFTPPSQTDFTQTVTGTEQLVIDRLLSKSYMTALSDEEKDKATVKVKEVLQKGDGRVWIDEKDGTFEYPYLTNLFVFERR